MKTILQHDERDCGAACLAMISDHFGRKVSIAKCRELTKIDRSGCNIYGLVDGAGKLDISAEALSGNPQELLEEIQKGGITFPFVAHVVVDGALLHFVVVTKISGNTIHIADPGRGKVRLSLNDFFEIWTGYVVTFAKTPEFRKINETKGSLVKFFSLLKGLHGKLWGILFISIAMALVGVIGAAVLGAVIDGLTNGSGASTQSASGVTGIIGSFIGSLTVENVSRIFICLIVLYVLQAIVSFVRGKLILSVGKQIDIKLTLGYYNHIVDMPVSSISLRQTGEYLSRFSDASTIRDAISNATLTLILDAIMGIGGGIILFLQNRQLFLLSLILIVSYAVVVLSFRIPIDTANRTSMENDAKLQSYFKESIDGVETVKAAGAENSVKAKTTARFNEFIDSTVKVGTLSISQDSIVGAVELIGTAVILWLGFVLAIKGSITLGSLMTFYAMLGYFTDPVKNLIELQPTIQAAVAAADRLNDILELTLEDYDDRKEELSVNEWKVENCDFRYGNRQLVLKDVSFSVKKGEKVAIIGESGSGKTTIAKLMLRFYSPEKGQILLDGKPIEDIPVSTIRDKVAYIDQNTFLFSDTIKNNLKLGNPNASDEEIEKACRVSFADKFIEEMPMKYDTPLDENGSNLSGGQKQRLAIARAILKKPELMIMDEATSNLDTITENGIKSAIEEISKDMALIIIAHRLSTIKECDRIIVMDKGEIAETGTHDELIAKDSLYAKYWKNMQ